MYVASSSFTQLSCIVLRFLHACIIILFLIVTAVTSVTGYIKKLIHICFYMLRHNKPHMLEKYEFEILNALFFSCGAIQSRKIYYIAK